MKDLKEKQANTERKTGIELVVYIMYLIMFILAFAIIIKIVRLQIFFNPDEKIMTVMTPPSVQKTLEPVRGNIIDCNGKVLAMSYPLYSYHMDCTLGKDEEWYPKAETLSEGLSRVMGDRSAESYYNLMCEGRAKGKKYMPLGHEVDITAKEILDTLPFFNEGKYRGGIIMETNNTRKYPFGSLARRTIGFVRKNPEISNNMVGIEGKFNSVLHGTNGVEWQRRTDNGMVRDLGEKYRPAIDGEDIHTTLNIDYQAIADRTLKKYLGENPDLEGGCVIMMDVRTGAVRIMVNLLRDSVTNRLEEVSNLAIGRLGDPGSVFKLTTLASLIEDGYVTSIEEKIPTNRGHIKGFRDDDHIIDLERKEGIDSITIIKGLQISSNYVFRYLADKYYGKDPGRYVDHLRKFRFTEKYDFDLDGFATPQYRDPAAKDWSGTDLGSMAIGYSVSVTPMHTLSFYNAIANGGKMMKPFLVEGRGPSVMESSLFSKATSDTLKRGLRTVVSEKGATAWRLNTAATTVAGKTGTAEILLDNGRRKGPHGETKKQGTFIGFFPYENPQYTIITVLYTKPSRKTYYGGTIPAQVTKDIIDGLVNLDPYWQEEI